MDRIPGEFKYWDHIDSPRARRTRRVLRALFGVDPKLDDKTVLDYAHSYFDADPTAEAFAEESCFKEQGTALLKKTLAHGLPQDAPASMRRLFAELDAPWLDRDFAKLGARVFRRFGTHMFFHAGAITLHGYRESSVAKPLAFTGTYTGTTAKHRFLETAAFWVDVSEPGGMEPGGRGLLTALRVRMMHVFVRRRLMAHPKWKLDAWGVPISQGDALLTLMGGSFVPGYLLKTIGYRTSREEILAMMHFWRYVGHVMGVQPRWYPETIKEALGLMFTAEVKGVQQAGEDGRNLAQSYVAAYAPDRATDRAPDPTERLRKALEYRLQLGYVRHFVPPPSHRALGLPRAGIWRLHPLFQFPLNFARETARLRSARLDDWLDSRVQSKTKRWLDQNLGPRKTEYKATTTFTR